MFMNFPDFEIEDFDLWLMLFGGDVLVRRLWHNSLRIQDDPSSSMKFPIGIQFFSILKNHLSKCRVCNEILRTIAEPLARHPHQSPQTSHPFGVLHTMPWWHPRGCAPRSPPKSCDFTVVLEHGGAFHMALSDVGAFATWHGCRTFATWIYPNPGLRAVSNVTFFEIVSVWAHTFSHFQHSTMHMKLGYIHSRIWTAFFRSVQINCPRPKIPSLGITSKASANFNTAWPRRLRSFQICQPILSNLKTPMIS